MSKNIKLGVKLKCIVTGFKGIATGKCEYLNGCVQWLVKPRVDKAGKDRSGQWIDEQQLEIAGKGVSINQKDLGGPMDAPGEQYSS